MFIEFQVGNFRSFRDIQTFSMQAAALRPNDGGLEEGNVFRHNELRLLKTKAIYGQNASGKSNLIEALGAFCHLVDSSVRREGLSKELWEDRFLLLKDWDNQPVYFQYLFTYENLLFRYGFEVLAGKICYEWLFENGHKDEVEYFFRSPQQLTVNKEKFSGADLYIEQAANANNELFRSDSLFLTGAALTGSKLAAGIRNEIRHLVLVDGVKDDTGFNLAFQIYEQGTDVQKKQLSQILKAADTGIESLSISEVPEDLLTKAGVEYRQKAQQPLQTLFSQHHIYDEEGKVATSVLAPFLKWESAGTVKFLGLGAQILTVLQSGSLLFIDEFDARFHPNLTLKIVELFQSEITNPNNAQLVFITHDSSLLRRAGLRRDQIAIVDKDRYGISTLKTLIEYKGVRKDASYDKEYLQGSYAGVPYLDELDSVITEAIHNGVPAAK